MGLVDLADTAHAMGRQELGLVEHPLEDTRQHGVIDQGQQVLAALVLPVRTGADMVTAKEPPLARVQHLAEARGVPEQSPVDDLGGEQGDQAHPGIHVDVVNRAVRSHQQVLEEPRLHVPQGWGA